MRWARYATPHGPRYAIVEDGRLHDVEGTPFGEHARSGTSLALSEARLLPPIAPRNFFAVGFNYIGHTDEASGFLKNTVKVPANPDVGSRFPSALIGHGDEIVVPANSSGVVQFEGELVAVIGKTAKGLSEDEVMSAVFGYTIGNDVSERNWQAGDRTPWRAKNADTFKPMGPWIETEVDLSSLVTRIRLNGEQVSQFDTNNMIFGIARFLSVINQSITLQPGDMIWMGAEAPSLDMRAGDEIEIEINQIGTLRNTVVADRGA